MESFGEDIPEDAPNTDLVLFVYVALVLFVLICAITEVQAVGKAEVQKQLQGFPLVGLPEDGLSPKAAWVNNGYKVLAKGMREHAGAFQVMTETGPRIILPHRFAQEFRRHEDANRVHTFGQDFVPTCASGLDGVTVLTRHKRTFVDTVRVDFAQSLGLVTDALVDEAKRGMFDIFGDQEEWQEIPIKAKIGQLAVRLSSRAFVGEELCRNQEWLRIAQKHTNHVFVDSIPFRRVISSKRFGPEAYLHPFSIRLRQQGRHARRLLRPEIEKRKVRVRQAMADEEKPGSVSDALGWLVLQARGRDIDYANGQLGMTVVGTRTTTEVLSEAIIDLCNNQHLFEPLRKEVVEVVQEEGWSPAALHKMRLMDSFLKESQRMHPSSAFTFNRIVLERIELSDGTILPKRSRVFSAGPFFDPKLYADPERFDAYRFLKASSNDGQGNNWQYTPTTPEYLGFIYGPRGCPGGFFAAAQLKIALSFLLLNYDWKLAGASDIPNYNTFEKGTVPASAPQYQASFRTRQTEKQL